MAQRRPAFGLHLPVMDFFGGTASLKLIAELARRAERLGFDAVSANDHIVFSTGWLDPLICLAATAASSTTKIKLATSVLNIVVRNPMVAAKALSCLDAASGGRVLAGVGPGSYKPDYDACGIPFEERWRRFSECLEILVRSLGDSAVNYSGIFYAVKDVTIRPLPLQKPQVWIGSWGSDAGLRRVAKYGDGWMASAYNVTPEQFSERWKRVLYYAREQGKSPDAMRNAVVTMFTYVAADGDRARERLTRVLAPALGRPAEELHRMLPFGTPQECCNMLRRLVEQGVERIHFWPVGDEEEQMEVLAEEVIPGITPA